MLQKTESVSEICSGETTLKKSRQRCGNQIDSLFTIPPVLAIADHYGYLLSVLSEGPAGCNRLDREMPPFR